MRLILLSLSIVGPAAAQIISLATTGNGEEAYFSTQSPFQGSNAPSQGRIYRIGKDGLQSVVDIPLMLSAQPGYPQMTFSNYYQLSQPDVSRDGSVLVFTGQRTCSGSDLCVNFTTLETTATGVPTGTVSYTGSGRINGNGRFLLIHQESIPGGSLVSVADLQTGAVQMPNPPVSVGTGFGSGRVIADDGTAVWAEAGDLCLLQGTKVTHIPRASYGLQEAVIDSNAMVIVYTLAQVSSSVQEIHAYQVSTQKDVTLAGAGYNFAPYLSADGSRVMFLSTASGTQQVWTVNTDGSALHQVTNDPTTVLSAAMSDDGLTAWYNSGSGYLIQINLDTGETKSRIGPILQLDAYGGPVVPGSVLTVGGAGFSDGSYFAEAFPLPLTLGGVDVTIGGLKVPLYSVAPTKVVVQVPWEIPVSDTQPWQPVDVEVGTSAASPFLAQVSQSLVLVPAHGTFVTSEVSDPLAYSNFDTLVVHEKWDGLVTAMNPARPNEIVHLFGFGFGRVDSPPPTGTPAPGDPPAHTIVPVNCTTYAADNRTIVSIPVLFSGLAPGLAGYYQLDVRLPALNLSAPVAGFHCSGEGGEPSSSSFYASFPFTATAN